MARIKINVRTGYGSGDGYGYVLPPIENTDVIAAAIARAVKVNKLPIGGDWQNTVLVTEPTSCIDVQIVDDEVVMTRKQHAEASAAWHEEDAARKAKDAEKARLVAVATTDD